jgi:GTP-binding protein
VGARPQDYFRVSVADLPGLIDGASENRGLGHRFLQHVERTKVLVLVVDVAPAQEGRERAAGEDLQALLRELDLYDPGLSSRPSIVVANKMDSRFAARGLESLRRAAPESAQGRVIPVSALTGVGVPEFVRALRLLVEGQPPRASREAAA